MSKIKGYYLEAIRWLTMSKDNRKDMMEDKVDPVIFPYSQSFYRVNMYLYRVNIAKMSKHT